MGKAWFGMDFRSPQQRAQDEALYERWAFVHGAPQRAAVCAALDKILPRVHQEERLFCYLMVREAYWGSATFGLPCADDEDAALRKARELSVRLHADEVQALLALVRLDASMDEGLDYSAAI